MLWGGKWRIIYTVQNNHHREEEKELTLKSWKDKCSRDKSDSESMLDISLPLKMNNIGKTFKFLRHPLKSFTSQGNSRDKVE